MLGGLEPRRIRYNNSMNLNTGTPRPHTHFDLLRARIRKTAFEALYGPFAPAYDWVSRTFFLGQWRVWQRAAIPYLRGKDVLEVGMGTGNLQADLLRAGYRAWGIDLSPQMLRQAVRKARRRGVPLYACRARAQHLPFAAGQFDSVVSTFPSEYIIEPATLRELHRVLRRGGRLVIVPSGWLRPKGARGKVFEGVARAIYGDQRGGTNAPAPEEIAHSQHLGWAKALEGRMQEAGFTVQSYVASNEQGATLVIVADKVEG